MKLENIPLQGLGAFTETPGGFRIHQCHIEEPWSYFYGNQNILVKVNQQGLDQVQFQPPAGTVLLKRERFQRHSSFLVWLKTDDGRAFTNFFEPAYDGAALVAEPDEFVCEYAPEKVVYRVRWQGIQCDTELMVPAAKPVLVVTCRVANVGKVSRTIDLFPVLRPHLAAAALAPWDVPTLYQKVSYHPDHGPLFLFELRNPAGLPEKREQAFLLADLDSPDAVAVSYDAFVGRGSFARPEGLAGLAPGGGQDAINGRQGIAALQKTVRLPPGQEFQLQVVMGRAGAADNRGGPMDLAQVLSYRKYFSGAERQAVFAENRRAMAELVAHRRIDTPDPAFDRYVNEFLPLQLKWVSLLDRGWPTGMRGTRDSAQDATALVPLDPGAARQRLFEVFRVQRPDGWFPRQYSIFGPTGTHDRRNYVDGGVWVWELLYEYLCHTKDYALLGEETGFLDGGSAAPILDHVARLIGYYLQAENLGAHGLCLIREGDWNDSINRAGLEGRGESVMVSCQVVAMLRQAAVLGRFLESRGGNGSLPTGFPADCVRQADRLKENLLRHAFNGDGYFNGVFTDAGEWVFSPRDPDGQHRINVPVNAFALISGIVQGSDADRLLAILAALKGRDGWPLFQPGIGIPPIDKLGRIGTGDLAMGLGENGTPYNHGSHGFLGRAAAAHGRGDLLREILRFMLPYDQEAHPVERARTAPYGVVNHWKTAPGQEGRGGDLFLSGSISTALRNIYGGMFGIRPRLDGLAIHPCLPAAWREPVVHGSYRGSSLEIRCVQTATATTRPRLCLDQQEISTRVSDEVLAQEYPFIPDERFQKGRHHVITCQQPLAQ